MDSIPVQLKPEMTVVMYAADKARDRKKRNTQLTDNRYSSGCRPEGAGALPQCISSP